MGLENKLFALDRDSLPVFFLAKLFDVTGLPRFAVCRDFISGAKRRYDSRDLGPEDMHKLHRFTVQQIYDKAKYMRRRHGK